MYRRYVIVGVVFFLLIGAYFVFFDKKDNKNEYEKYYKKLVNREEFSNSLEGVSLSIDVIEEENSRYTYIVTFDNVSEKKENVKILVLNEKCDEKSIEEFPSFGIIANKGFSLVKNGEEDEENKLLRGVNLTIINSEEIDYFIIYFASGNSEQFVKVQVSAFSN